MLKDNYYIWLAETIDDGDRGVVPYFYSDVDICYTKVLEALFNEEFIWSVKNDDNRAADGLELREKFCNEKNLYLVDLERDLPAYCTVLEMMVALAARMEDALLYDPLYGNQTPRWFWIMIDNLGLNDFDDENFDEIEVGKIIHKMLRRLYGRDGRGGLFYVNCHREDMRKTEIWYQMNYFVEEFLEN